MALSAPDVLEAQISARKSCCGVPPKCTRSSPNPRTAECDCIWKWALQRGDQFKIRLLGWVLIQTDQCPCEKKSGPRKGHQGCVHTMERPGQDTARGQRPAGQGERPQEKPTCQHLDLGLQASTPGENSFPLLRPPGCCVLLWRSELTVVNANIGANRGERKHRS